MDNIIFNGNDLSELVFCRIGRPILPPVENTVQDIPGRDGAIFRSRRFQTYQIPVTMWLRTRDRRDVAAARHELAALLFTDEPKPLYLPDDPDIYHLAIVEGETALEQISDALQGTTVNFLVCDPIGYGETRTQTLPSSLTTISVGGTWKSYPIITIRPLSTTNAKVTNVSTGEYVEITSTSAGASLSTSSDYVIDMGKERVTVNNNSVGVTAESDFFSIEGSTQIRLLNCTAQIEWVERWL